MIVTSDSTALIAMSSDGEHRQVDLDDARRGRGPTLEPRTDQPAENHEHEHRARPLCR